MATFDKKQIHNKTFAYHLKNNQSFLAQHLSFRNLMEFQKPFMNIAELLLPIAQGNCDQKYSNWVPNALWAWEGQI